MKKIIIAFFVGVVLSGCATLDSVSKNDWNIKKLIRYSGTSENVSYNLVYDTSKIIEMKKTFSFSEPRVTWWAEVWDRDMLPLYLHVQWYSPNSELYKEYDFFAAGNRSCLISTALPVKNNITSQLSGSWKVKVFFRGIELASDEFYIGGMEKSNVSLSDEELKRIFPELDKADTLILLRENRVKVDKSFKTESVIKRRIKILSDRGKEKSSIMNIPFYSDLESVNVNMAHTIKPSGEIVEAKEMQMFSPFEHYGNYKATRILSIAMPSLEKGSIIEYEVETTSLINQTLPNFQDEFYFDQTEPVLESKYIVVVPDKFDFKIDGFKFDTKPEITADESDKTKKYVWTKNNIPSVQVEVYMPPAREVLSHVDIYTDSSWDIIAEWWSELVKGRLIVDSDIENKAKELTKGALNNLDKVKRIYSFIQSEVRYVQVPFGASPYQPTSAASTLKNRYGDCKDQITLLISMLKSIGIDNVYYGLARTKEEGSINKKTVSAKEFNHVIAVANIDGKEMFLDTTAKYLEFGSVPFSIQGQDVLVINGKQTHFETIPFSEADNNQINSVINLDIKKDFQIEGEIKIDYKGQDEWSTRTYLEAFEQKQKEQFINAILNNLYPGAKLKNYSISNDKNQHLGLTIRFSLSNWLENVEGFYLLKVVSDELVSPPEFLSLDRKFPIKYDYRNISKSEISITLPDNVTIKSLPNNFFIESPYLTSSIKYSKEGRKIIRQQFIKATVVDLEVQDIAKHKETWDEVFKAHKQGITLLNR